MNDCYPHQLRGDLSSVSNPELRISNQRQMMPGLPTVILTAGPSPETRGVTREHLIISLFHCQYFLIRGSNSVITQSMLGKLCV